MKNTLICTVGTSLLRPNLFGLPQPENYAAWLKQQPSLDQAYLTEEMISALATAFAKKETAKIAELLFDLPGSTRLCGAEINSIHDLVAHRYCQERCTLIFCHSDTVEGRQVAEILRDYYVLQDYQTILWNIEDLQDSDPKRFRTKGLRNLAKKVCQIVHERIADYCAINATGGYKAQIAISVLMGQALGVPIYYKHELFSEIIAFPPMPISLDHALWMKNCGLLAALDQKDILREADLDLNDWDERLETLIERVEIDGETYLEISPTGQIFHETFKGRFESDRDQFLPPAVPKTSKSSPVLSDHSWGNAREPILRLMQRITDEAPFVRACRTDYWNPDLSRVTLCRLKGDEIECIFSNGSWTVKMTIETSSSTLGQREACIADLNHRMRQWL